MPDITRRTLLADHTDFGTDGHGGFCPSQGDKPHRSIFIVMQSMNCVTLFRGRGSSDHNHVKSSSTGNVGKRCGI